MLKALTHTFQSYSFQQYEFKAWPTLGISANLNFCCCLLLEYWISLVKYVLRDRDSLTEGSKL